jgi:hypothetical protein
VPLFVEPAVPVELVPLEPEPVAPVPLDPVPVAPVPLEPDVPAPEPLVPWARTMLPPHANAAAVARVRILKVCLMHISCCVMSL